MKKPFCFELRHPEKRCYYFQGECSEVVAEWATAMYRPIAWIDSDIANRYLDRDVVKKYATFPFPLFLFLFVFLF